MYMHNMVHRIHVVHRMGVAAHIASHHLLPGCLACCRFRELGCTCTAAKLAAGVAADGNPTAAVASYNVALLPTGKKTLEESFPKFKTGAKQRAGR